MRILAVSHEYPPIGGGGANAAYNLLNGFVDRGNRVTLITTGYVGRDSIPPKSGFEIKEVASRRSNPDSSSFMEMFDFLIRAYFVANRTVRRSSQAGDKFDVVLVFFGIPGGPIGYMLKKKYHIPYIIRFGGGDIPGAQKRFDKIYKLLSPAIKTIWKNADCRVPNSEGLKDRAIGFYDKCDYTIIPNGVDIERFYPDEVSRSKQKDFVNLLFVSRLIEGKGLQHIIPKLIDIETGTDKRILLTIVGDGPYRKELERITMEYGAEHMVVFMGKKQGDELIELYQSGDIFILPSSNEGMPNVVLEAMSCGLPIIMTPCQGSKELVHNNGYIVPEGEFPEKIIELVNNPEQRQNMGRRSREIAVESFSWNSTVDKYLSVMSTVLGEK